MLIVPNRRNLIRKQINSLKKWQKRKKIYDKDTVLKDFRICMRSLIQSSIFAKL